MTLTDRIATIEAQRDLPSNVIPFERRPRRQVPRWIEWTRENQTNPNAGKSYDSRWGGGNDAA